jgi:hypothetical protein
MVDENSNIWFGGDTSDMATNPYSAIIGYVSAVGSTNGLRAWSMTNEDTSGKYSVEAANALAWHPAGKPVVAGFCGYSGGEWEAVGQEGANIPSEVVGTAVGTRASLDAVADPLVDITGDVDTSPLNLGIEDDGGGLQDALVIFGTPLD